MIRRNTFKCFKEYPSVLESVYELTGNSGEGISWRNIFGFPCEDVSVMENTLAAGLYDLAIDGDSLVSFSQYESYLYESIFETYPSMNEVDIYGSAMEQALLVSPLELYITNGSIRNLLSPSVDKLGTVINALGGYQDQFIPGLRIKIKDYGQLNPDDKFQVNVGGRWVSDEQRNIEDLFFGTVSANGPASSSVTISVKNNSGYTLESVKVKVVNKISIYQPQDQGDLVVNRDRPFSFIAQQSLLSPAFSVLEYRDITFANFDNPLIDMIISGQSCDVIDVVYGSVMERAERLMIDTSYQLLDDSPYPGLTFVLSPQIAETDTAKLYVSNGADVFELRKDDTEIWKHQEEIVLSDSLANQGTVNFQIRVNPFIDIKNSQDYPVEGLIQISGSDGVDTHITSIPLSTVIIDRFPSLNIRTTLFDDSTFAVLESFGISTSVLG